MTRRRATLTWLLLALFAGCSQPVVPSAVDAGMPCAAGQTDCAGACVSLASDDRHCGACGTSCGATESCAGASCRADDCADTDCASDQVCVSGRCIAKACVGVSCRSGQLCHQRECIDQNCLATPCPTGSACIGGRCTDVACLGVICPTGRRCELGACVMAGCNADLMNDAANCGQCGRVCPLPANAPARCAQGSCGRGPCNAGFFDLDGPATPGCEASCAGATCTLPDGGVVGVTNPPVPESGAVARALASGSSHGAQVQTSATHSNLGVLGEETPPAERAVESTNATHRNIGGFNSQLRRP